MIMKTIRVIGMGRPGIYLKMGDLFDRDTGPRQPSLSVAEIVAGYNKPALLMFRLSVLHCDKARLAT